MRALDSRDDKHNDLIRKYDEDKHPNIEEHLLELKGQQVLLDRM